MSKLVIITGVSWYAGTRIENVVAGYANREQLDQLVAQTPAEYRSVVAKWFAPLLEGREPPRAGVYPVRACGGVDPLILWWKRASWAG